MLITAVVAQTVLATFAAPADTAARLLPKLGESIGLRLSADRTAGMQILLVHVRGMYRDRLLKLLAEGTGGVWETIEGGYRLTLGASRLRALRQEEAKRRESWIAQARSKAPPPLGEAIKSLGDGMLAELGTGSRIVWSSAPTRLQRVLPSNQRWGDLLAKRETARLQAAQHAHPEEQGYEAAIEAAGRTIETTLLTARRGLDSTSVGIRLSTYDESGTFVGEAKTMLAPPPPPTLSVAPEIGRKPITLPPEFQVSEDSARTNYPNSVIARLAHPEMNEPLAFIVGPVIERIADELKADVVASLPDSVYQKVQEASRNRPDLGGWLRAFQAAGVQSRLDNGALIVRPDDLPMAVERRTDRAALRQRIACLETHGDLTLDFPPSIGFVDDYIEVLPYHRRSGESGTAESHRFAQAWLALSPSQRDAALRGGSSIAPDAPFWSSLREMVERLEQPEERGLMLALEPTILFAQKVGPRDGVEAKLEASPAAVYRMPNDPFAWAVPTVAEAARDLARSGPNGPLRQASYWPASHRRLTLSVHLGNIRWDGNVGETVRAPGGATRYPNLFPALRQALDRL